MGESDLEHIMDNVEKDIFGDEKKGLTPRERAYHEAAKNLTLGDVGGEWIPLDGAEFVASNELLGESDELIEDHAYGPSMPVARDEQIGKFASNGGSLIFIDGEGRKYMGPMTDEAVDSLIRAGYRRGDGIAVPHMFDMDTRFKDDALQAKWLELAENARKLNEEKAMQSQEGGSAKE